MTDKPLEWRETSHWWCGGRFEIADCRRTHRRYAAFPSGKAEWVSLFDSSSRLDKINYDKNINHYYYLSDCKKQYGNVYSYAAIENNDREWQTSHDLMHYLWINTYSISGCPKLWRPMTVTEAYLFSKTLFRFGRPSWANPKGKNPLSLEQCKLLTKF